MIQPHMQRRAVQRILQVAGRNVGTDLRMQRQQVMRCLSVVGDHLVLRPPPPLPFNNFGPDHIRHARGFVPHLGGLPIHEESDVATPTAGSSGSMTTLQFDLTCGEEDDDGG